MVANYRSRTSSRSHQLRRGPETDQSRNRQRRLVRYRQSLREVGIDRVGGTRPGRRCDHDRLPTDGDVAGGEHGGDARVAVFVDDHRPGLQRAEMQGVTRPPRSRRRRAADHIPPSRGSTRTRKRPRQELGGTATTCTASPLASLTREPCSATAGLPGFWARRKNRLMMRMMVATKGKPIAQSFQKGLHKLESKN